MTDKLAYHIRMVKKQIHTVPSEKGWTNKQGGQELSKHKTKAAAEAAGREKAKDKKAEHVIHNADGTISKRNSYGNDPYPPKG